MNVTTLEDKLYDWIFSIITPSTPLWLNQNSPRPSGGYVGMRHNAENLLGNRGYKSKPVGTTNVVTVTQDLEFMLMLVGYGVGAASIYRIFDYAQLPLFRAALSLAGVAIVDIGSVMDTSELVNSQIEARQALDLRLRVGNVLTYTSNIIESVEMGLTIKDGSRNVVHETITIPEV